MPSDEGKGGSAPPLIKHHHRIASRITSGPPCVPSVSLLPSLTPPLTSPLDLERPLIVNERQGYTIDGQSYTRTTQMHTTGQVVAARAPLVCLFERTFLVC